MFEGRTAHEILFKETGTGTTIAELCTTRYIQILAMLAVDGYKLIEIDNKHQFFLLISHPSMVEYTNKNLIVEDNRVYFKIFGLTIQYRNKKEK